LTVVESDVGINQSHAGWAHATSSIPVARIRPPRASSWRAVSISHPQIRDVSVVGKPDPRWGELVARDRVTAGPA
jgi:hypothetical protein